jgi:hypothetical protein
MADAEPRGAAAPVSFGSAEQALDGVGAGSNTSGEKPLRISQKRNRNSVSRTESFIQTDATIPPFMILQEDPRKTRWDLAMALLIFYSVITIPFRLAFLVDAEGYYGEHDEVALVIDVMIDIFFFLDIILSFRTCFVNPEGTLITDACEIAKVYAKGWFIIDFVSTVPIDRLASLSSSADSDSLRVIKVVRVLRLVRLIKLVKLLQIDELLDTYENYIPIPRGMISITVMVARIVFVAHLIACMWYALGRSKCDTGDPPYRNNACTWIGDYWGVDDPTTLPESLRYTASLYWAITTMATVGYGDINTQNNYEVAFTVFAMCVGASAFGYTIGIISDRVQNAEIWVVGQRNKMGCFMHYSNAMALPYPLHKRVKKHWKYLCEKEGVFEQQEMLMYMPVTLRNTCVQSGSYAELIRCVPRLLKTATSSQHKSFLADVIPRLKPFMLKVSEVLFNEGSVGWHIYFVINGKLRLEATRKGEPALFKHITSGEVIGHNYVLDGSLVRYSATAEERDGNDIVEMTSLAKDDVLILSKIWYEIQEEFQTNYAILMEELETFLQTGVSPDSVQRVTSSANLNERKEADRLKGIFHNPTPEELWDEYRLIHPEATYKIYWDMFVGILILFSVVIVPFRLCFYIEDEPYAKDLDIVDIFIDLTFALDMALSFRTSFFSKQRELNTDPSRAAIAYLKGWFTIDFMTTFPFDRIAAKFVADPGSIRVIKMLRVVRLARLAKLAKVLQNGPLFEVLEDLTAGIDPSIFNVLFLFLQLFFCAHMIGCVWHLICSVDKDANWLDDYFFKGTLESAMYKLNMTAMTGDGMVTVSQADVGSLLPGATKIWWDGLDVKARDAFLTDSVSNNFAERGFSLEGADETMVLSLNDNEMHTRYDEVSEGMHGQTVGTRYLTSVYWALATMTTVGYGDISANSMSELEMVVAMLSMLCGTTVFAYVIGEVVMAILHFDPAEKEFISKKR